MGFAEEHVCFQVTLERLSMPVVTLDVSEARYPLLICRICHPSRAKLVTLLCIDVAYASKAPKGEFPISSEGTLHEANLAAVTTTRPPSPLSQHCFTRKKNKDPPET